MALGRENRSVEHKIYNIEDIYGELDKIEINNVIFETKEENLKWVANTTKYIADFRSEVLSSYIRWSIAINGLYIAQEKYSNPIWKKSNKFHVNAIRKGDLNEMELKPIVEWTGDIVVENHSRTTLMMSSWGIIDLFGLLEKFILNIFDFYFEYHPNVLMQGDEFKQLRKIYRQRNTSDENLNKWNEEFNKRIYNWKRKKLYEGLDKVFMNYSKLSELYVLNEEQWNQHAACIKALSVLRNCLIHGNDTATKELEEVTQEYFLSGIRFVENEKLIIQTEHLQSVELYFNNLLTNLNESLIKKIIQ